MSKLFVLKSGTHEILSDALFNDFSNLKQQALLFDQIGIYKLNQFYSTLEENSGLFILPASQKLLESIISELRWLEQTGVVFELKLDDELYNLGNIKANLGKKLGNAQYLLNRVLEIHETDLRKAIDNSRKKELIQEQQTALLRFLAIIMEASKGITAVTTLPYSEYTRNFPHSQKSEVSQIVIKKLPLPSNETPWEQITDYRNDSDNQKSLLSLRRWIRKISAGNVPLVEIEEELDWLINEFQNHMRLHKIKANTETLEVFTKTPFEIIENIIKLKFSKLPEPIFILKKRQIKLMEAELNAPGREIAYIIKTKEAFQSNE